MDPSAMLRRAHAYSLEDFKALWASVRELVLIETLDDRGRAQGEAVVHMDQLYQCDADGSFAKVSYIACSDEYYQWWCENEMGDNVFHHFCRSANLKGCLEKVGTQGVVHVMQWVPITRPEGEHILRGWGFSPALVGRVPRPVPAEDHDHGSGGRPASKSGQPRPPPGLTRPRSPIPRRAKHKPQEHGEDDRDEQDEADEQDERRSGMARPVSPVRGDGKKHRHKHKDSRTTALDKMLDGDPVFDADSDKLRGEAHVRLATLREALQQKKAEKGKSDPGAILADRAAAVAVSSGRKRKKDSDKVLDALTKVFKKKGIKEEVDYDDDDAHHGSGSSDLSDTDEEEKRLLGGSLGSSSSAMKQRQLRQLSERKPGKILKMGFASMHEQVGTYFGRDANKDVLTPVALRYLLSYALPQIRGGISHDRYRELRTLATCLDHMVAGQAGQAGDLLLQRYKALLMTQRDGSDAASRYIELLPEEEMPTMASAQESYLARTMAVQQAKSEELLRRAST